MKIKQWNSTLKVNPAKVWEWQTRSRKGRDTLMIKWSVAVKQAASYRCEYCGAPDSLESHHILARRAYPEYKYFDYNGVCLCRDCHRKIHNNTSFKEKVLKHIDKLDWYTYREIKEENNG